MEYTEIQKIIENAKSEYKTIRKVFCPYLGQEINFTERGFNHLIYKDRDMRPYNEITVRLNSLKFVPKIISRSGTLQEYEKRDVQYFGFIAIIQSKKYKVVILKDTTGEYRFVSIIPKYRHNTQKARLFQTTTQKNTIASQWYFSFMYDKS